MCYILFKLLLRFLDFFCLFLIWHMLEVQSDFDLSIFADFHLELSAVL